MASLELFNQKKMSSREIAELTGKRHDHVLRDCDVLNVNYQELALPKIGEGLYTHPNTGNQQHREYLLTKMQTMDLMTGYRIDLRIKVNRRWEALETANNSPELQMAQGLLAAQKLIESKDERIQILEVEKDLLIDENNKLAPKANYTDVVLKSVNTYTSTQVAKELGFRAAEQLHKELKKQGIMFYQSGQWLLTAKYCGKGYTKPRTHNFTHSSSGLPGTNTITVWTEEGRRFLHTSLKIELPT